MFKPTRSKLYLTLFLTFNIFFAFAYVLSQGFSDIDIPFFTIVLLNPPYFLIILATILFSYIFACIVTIKLPQFWQPTMLKTLPALFFGLILFIPILSTNFIPKTTDFVNIIIGYRHISPPSSYPSSHSTQPAFDSCPLGTAAQMESLCGYHDYSNIEVVIALGSFAIAIVAYALSCVITDFIRKMNGRKNN